MKKVAKFIHILNHNELKFSVGLVKLINDSQNGFIPQEHIFVTMHSEVYDAIKDYSNTEFYQPRYHSVQFACAALINYYAARYPWVILHSISSAGCIFLIKKRYLKKIIWRTWGHDPHYIIDKPNDCCLKKLVKKFLGRTNAGRDKILHSFRAIGIANAVDQIDIETLGKNIPCFPLNYGLSVSFAEQSRWKENLSVSHKELHIMVGHSAFSYDHHVDILQSLHKWKNEKIRVYLPVSYGDPQYIQQLKETQGAIWGDKLVWIEDFMPYEKYVDVIRDMDIVFFDGEGSCALGNIGLAVLFEKKIFLNRNGVIRKAFDLEKVPYYFTDQVKDMTFEEFACLDHDPFPENSTLRAHSKEEECRQWQEFLQWLDKCETDGR